MKAKLVLENGTVFDGESFGAEGKSAGELVFTTGMTGYQETLTDPSYCGQIVTMTYPLIGNYGVNPADMEGDRPRVAGFVVREYSRIYSNHRATESLGGWLARHGVVAIQGVDTRMLTRIIRESGAMRAVISTTDLDDGRLLAAARSSPCMEGLDLTPMVTCTSAYEWTGEGGPGPGAGRFHVVVFDFGVKRSILRRLAHRGCRTTVVPASTTAGEALALNPDGIVLSNGPGDPDAVKAAIETAARLLDKKPLFGICLGHQILALALGGKTFKLKFGHRGANHPVRNLRTGGIEITSQNHGFAVDPASLDSRFVEITHVNLNDGTNEGFRHRELPVLSVQYHPEASPGPHDADNLFETFARLMGERSPVPA